MCFLVDLFFLIELFILIDFLHEAAHNGVSFCENSTVMGDKFEKELCLYDNYMYLKW